MVNGSLRSGIFPRSLEPAVVKSHLDGSILNKYRLIWNLPFIGKIIEKVVFNQRNEFLKSNGYVDNFPSGFWLHYRIGITPVKTSSDAQLKTDSGRWSVLVLLHLSVVWFILNTMKILSWIYYIFVYFLIFSQSTVKNLEIYHIRIIASSSPSWWRHSWWQ